MTCGNAAKATIARVKMQNSETDGALWGFAKGQRRRRPFGPDSPISRHGLSVARGGVSRNGLVAAGGIPPTRPHS